jgi:hypothetical protein
MNSFFKKAPPYLVPALFIVVIMALIYSRGETKTVITTDHQLSPGDIYSSKLDPVPNDSSHLQMTLKLTKSGVRKIKSFRRSGDSSVTIAYEGNNLGELPPDGANPALYVLILPEKDAIAAKLAIGR